MTDFTPASRPQPDASEEPLLDSFLREAIPEIKLSLGDLIDRDNARAIPDRYVKMLPVTTLVVTLRPDAARAVADIAAELEEELTDSVMRHGSLYDRDYRVRLKEAGSRGAPLFRVSVQPAGQPEPAPIAPAPPPPPEPTVASAEPTVASPPPRPEGQPVSSVLQGHQPQFVDPDATRVEGPGVPDFPAGRYQVVVEDEDGTDRERFPVTQPITTVGRQTDNPALQADVQLTGSPNVSRRQLALVWGHREGREGFDVYNLGLNAIHVGEREVAGANAGKGPLSLDGLGANSLWVAPGDEIRIGGHGPVVRIEARDEGERDAEPPVDPDATQFG